MVCMAIAEKKQGKNTYISYNYRDENNRHVWIYCGKKGKQSTEERIAKARKRHYEARLAKLERDFT